MLPGGTHSAATAINDIGVVVGTSFNGSAYQPVRWSGAGLEVLPSLGGFYSEALAINQTGLIVGHSQKPGAVSRAVAWTDGAIAELPSLSNNFSMASAVNDVGWIVGTSAPATGSTRAVLWIDGAVHDLAALVVNGSPLLFNASGINEQGSIVGEGEFAGVARAYLLTPVEPADLDADGLVDGADLGALLSAWGPCALAGGCPADLTGDGVVDGADLGVLLANWG